ncbi:MAG: sulfate adenylyltransferase [Thermoplasmata archaeon]|nr:sulfate adenylyltransferase [Thermoplasmata archaeon]
MIPEPHGGKLVDRWISGPEAERRAAELSDLPQVAAFVDQLYDAEKLGLGSYSPLDGFMDSTTLESVLRAGRLPDGTVWPIPILFPITGERFAKTSASLQAGDDLAIVDGAGRLLAILHLQEKFRFDKKALAQSVYGTTDPGHPNVAELLAGADEALAGKVDLLRRLELAGRPPELSPKEARVTFQQKGWNRVAAYQCRNPPHTAHEYIQRLTLEREDVDGLFIHPVVGRLKKGDYRPEVILQAYEALVKHYYPPDRVLMSPLTISMRYAGPKAALFLAIVRKNYGCGLYIVGRDQAGVGRFYDPYAAHRIFDEYDIGVTPLRYDESFFCRRCGWMASAKTCVHPTTDRMDTSQTRIRQVLAEGGELPLELLRPEVAAILRQPDVILTE